MAPDPPFIYAANYVRRRAALSGPFVHVVPHGWHAFCVARPRSTEGRRGRLEGGQAVWEMGLVSAV